MKTPIIKKPEAGKQASAKQSQVTSEKKTPLDKILEIESGLRVFGEYRLDVIKNQLNINWDKGYIPPNVTAEPGKWTVLTESDVNEIWRMLQHLDTYVSLYTLKNVLASRFPAPYNPLQDYVFHLQDWDGHDYIRDIVNGITLKDNSKENREYLYWTFSKWLTNMVGAWVDGGHVNDYIFLLIGGQNLYKTTFFNNLLPPCLRDFFQGNYNVNELGKDEYIFITVNALISFDDLESLNAKMMGRIKSLTTLRYVSVRRPYAKNSENIPRVASFCGTSNNDMLLADPNGEERRWLAHHVVKMTSLLTNPLNHDGLYSQVYHLYKEGPVNYRFTPEEVKEVNEHNKQYRVVNEADELVSKYFSIPGTTDSSEVLRATEVASYIEIHTRMRIPPTEIGKALKRLKFPSARVDSDNRGYRVHKKEDNEIAAETKFYTDEAIKAEIEAKKSKEPIEQKIDFSADTDVFDSGILPEID